MTRAGHIRGLGFRDFFLALLSCVVLLSLLSGGLYSQSNTGTLRGTVLDSSGSVVPAAQITLTNVETGVKLDTVTNQAGEYAFEFLQGGQYRLNAQVPGFKQFDRSGVLIETAKLVRVDISLETGEIQQTVEVTAQTSQVDTDSSTLNMTVSNTLFTELPNSTRDPRTLVALLPGYTNAQPLGTSHHVLHERRAGRIRSLLRRRRQRGKSCSGTATSLFSRTSTPSRRSGF